MEDNRFPPTPGIAKAVKMIEENHLGAAAARRRRHADQRLRAAAPDMLTALRGFVAACGGSPPDWLRDEFAAAENAIAKAEG